MPIAAAARPELIGAAARHGGMFSFALASDADDGDVRRLLRDHPLPGPIRLSFEREPAAALSASIEGDVHQTLVARDRSSGGIAGLAARSVRDVWVNGEARRVGYLGQLRVAGGRRRLRALMDEGFHFCRELHEAGDAPAYLMSLVLDNDAARRLLVERRSPTAPCFCPLGPLETSVIPARRARQASAHRIVRGSPALVDEIASCLQRNLRRYQLAPCWTAADLVSNLRTRGLAPEDFAVALSGDRVIGCAALWDQRAFRQVVVRGYGQALRRSRPFLNAAARLLALPRLPAVGEALRFAYVSHVAADDDRPAVIDALIAAQVARAHAAGLDYVMTGFPDRHPLQQMVRRSWARRTYRSLLYMAYWPDGESFVRSLDNRPAQPEVAVL